MISNDSAADEFSTVDAVLACGGSTRRVDALALCWIKKEKQLRRLFCYLVYQAPYVSEKNRDDYIAVMALNKNLYAESFIRGFDALCPIPLRTTVGGGYDRYMADIDRIKRYRNKILHGQITGLNLTSRKLETDVTLLRQWVIIVAESCLATIGYDGVGRNTFRKARDATRFVVPNYPFTTVGTFDTWLRQYVTITATSV